MHMQSWICAWRAGAMALLLVGCGGGNGSSGGALALSAAGANASVAAAAGTGATPASATPSPAAAPGAPVPTPSSPSANGPAPAFGALKVVELAGNLGAPWSLAFLPDGRMLITDRNARLLLRKADGSAESAGEIAGLPPIAVTGQGGLLDVVLDPAFASNQRIYFSFAERDGANAALNGTAVARAQLDVGARQLKNVVVIFRQSPKVDSGGHFGSRLVFSREGYLFVTLGDRQLDSQRGFAQDLSRGNGKVMRITTDGAPAPGNPFIGQAGKQPEIWTYGHRNPQGAALNPDTGELWSDEHGPQGGDEVNRHLPGKNYGWPLASYGQEYGTTTAVGVPVLAGTEPPVTVWERADGSAWSGGAKSSTAPSGMAFYTGTRLGGWQGSLFVGALAGQCLWRFTLSGTTVTGRERLLADRGQRIRDVRQGPDGWLYLLVDGDGGKLLRLERES